MGIFFPLGLGMSSFASLAGWIPNLIALGVASLLLALLGLFLGGTQDHDAESNGCLIYLGLNVAFILYAAFNTGLWTWKVLVDTVVLAAVLFLSASAGQSLSERAAAKKKADPRKA